MYYLSQKIEGGTRHDVIYKMSTSNYTFMWPEYKNKFNQRFSQNRKNRRRIL